MDRNWREESLLAPMDALLTNLVVIAIRKQGQLVQVCGHRACEPSL
jgi:hypothetical protein